MPRVSLFCAVLIQVDLECRAFKAEWSENYFVTELDGKALCFLCSDTIAVLKEYNIHWHYQTKHSAQYSQLTGKERSQKLETLKRSISLQRSFFTKTKIENKAVSKVSLRVAHLLAKEGKPFTDGELTLRYCAGVSHTPADVFLQLPKYGAYLLPARFCSLLL
jgi:hypothetical protein